MISKCVKRASGVAVSLFLIMIVSPVLATDKILEVRGQNLYGTVIFGPVTICGTTSVFTELEHTGQFHMILWSDGHSDFTFTFTAQFFDSSGNLIAQGVYVNQGAKGMDGLPNTGQFNNVMACAGKSLTPGQSFNVHFGFTFGEDGALKELHSLP